MRVLVTGGAGFIGSRLVARLAREGEEVVVLDDFSRGSEANLKGLEGTVRVVRGDVRDPRSVGEAARGAEGVVHLAALIDVAESVEKPDLYFDVNVRGTLNVLETARSAEVFVFASSAAVYGDPVRLPIAEDHPLRPLSPYGATKVAGEALVHAYAAARGFRPVILRLFNVYGPKQSRAYAGVVTEFVKRVLRGEPPLIYGDGTQSRDFVFVDDVVEYFVRALRTEEVRGIYNVGSGKAVSVLELAELVAKVLGRPELKPVHAPPRPGDIKHSVADISRAVRDFGYRPRVALEEGLRVTAEALAAELRAR
ncbi:MAG: SDR family NAD(P)-dependent oxidoreductase [Thermofilum sp.]|nr:SDR family NAD(P)-dependent oxidoreductase [Thermofilum sp.]MCC6064617.1 SDR family NAD(P)-dependent oxidoreductase [Thermofilum sp.]